MSRIPRTANARFIFRPPEYADIMLPEGDENRIVPEVKELIVDYIDSAIYIKNAAGEIVLVSTKTDTVVEAVLAQIGENPDIVKDVEITFPDGTSKTIDMAISDNTVAIENLEDDFKAADKDNKDNISKNAEAIAKANENITKTNNKVTELEAKVDNIDTTVNETVTKALESVEKDLADVDSKADANKAAIETLNGDAKTEGSVLHTVTGVLEDLVGDGSQATIDSLEELVDWANEHASDVIEMNNQITANKNNISTNTTNIATINTKITEIQTAIADIRNQLDNLGFLASAVIKAENDAGTVWTEDTAMACFTQRIDVAQMKETDYPVVDVSLSSNYNEALTQLDNYSSIYKIVTFNGYIVVYSNNKTSIDLNINIKVNR